MTCCNVGNCNFFACSDVNSFSCFYCFVKSFVHSVGNSVVLSYNINGFNVNGDVNYSLSRRIGFGILCCCGNCSLCCSCFCSFCCCVTFCRCVALCCCIRSFCCSVCCFCSFCSCFYFTASSNHTNYHYESKNKSKYLLNVHRIFLQNFI